MPSGAEPVPPFNASDHPASRRDLPPVRTPLGAGAVPAIVSRNEVSDRYPATTAPAAHSAVLPAAAHPGGSGPLSAPPDQRPGLDPRDLIRIGGVALGCAASGLGFGRAGRWDLVALTAVAAGGYPIWREALEALRERRMTMELSMSVAIVAAMAIGEFFTAAVIVLFVLVAEVLEGLTVRQGRRALRQLLDLLPRMAVVRRDGKDVEVAADLLTAGELVIVKPGARIPVDGVVVGGHSFVDQATITGESMPVEKQAGSQVFAGTINQSGALEVRTASCGRDTVFGRIVEAVERAEASRAPVQKVADRFAGYLVYFALASAVFTFLVTRDVPSAIAVVVVAGACGIAAGTPLAILGAIGQAARAGAIVKGGLYIEALGRVDTVVLDKTGTVTFGKPEVVDVWTCEGTDLALLLDTAATAEKRSEHPLAGAVMRRAESAGVSAPDPDRFSYVPGMGVACMAAGDQILVGNRALLLDRKLDPSECPEPGRELSEVLVARSGKLLGAIRIADVLRPEAAQAVRALRAMGMSTILLTGDAGAIASSIAARLGVDEVQAELLPAQKVARVRELRAQGRSVAMVGDGVNDAPALVEANVGVAMGSGTDVAMESASVVLLGNDLTRLVETVRIARRCRRIVFQNFAGTLAIDGLGVVLAACGVLTPLFAAFVHVASELAFILNSARLLPGGSGLVSGAERAPVGRLLDPGRYPTPSGS
jgi:Cd2+/Zn2+-exporting ATPase/Cu+-exporting ATPase